MVTRVPTGTNRPRAWFEHARACSGVLGGLPSPIWEGRRHPLTTDFGGYSGRVTPVPIPNTEVKTACADGTWG